MEHASQILPKLPIEVWERVMDHLWEDYPELLACSLVCTAWRPRSRFHLLSRALLQSRADVYRLSRNLKSLNGLRDQIHTLIIRGDRTETTRKPIPYLGTLATVLAGNPPHAEELGLWHACWRDIPDDTFLHLTTFVTVTKLTLAWVTFPNVLTFGRLVFALPSLETLACRDVSFEKKGPPATFHHQPTQIIDFDMLCGTPMDDVIDFVVETGYVAHGLEELHVAWWDPAPLLKELKALRVKSILQAASDSLLLFDIRLGGITLDPAETSNAIDELDLSRNTKLTELRLTLHNSKGSPEHTPVHPCTWLHALLTTITSKELAYLTIEFDVRDLDRGGDHDAALDIIAQLLTPEVASAIDALFAGEQFQGLESVYLGVFCARQGVLVDEEAWARVVRGRFPALNVRGILHTSSSVSISRLHLANHTSRVEPSKQTMAPYMKAAQRKQRTAANVDNERRLRIAKTSKEPPSITQPHPTPNDTASMVSCTPYLLVLATLRS
ncbi:hypothetical protein FOMPIDRAFT_115409 [Fomitopsis schrenkii]|uniref:F-box domain-containing protein n=1 Tax=Fomitopsis schrenkii TaxID=2126942 RepID=S8E7W6_FOMSC|nr:hypothetical protein FOMPIDRAFT_115409 [Fomitopsis schrenkii]